MLREGLAKDAMRGGEQGAGGLETSKPKGRRAVKLFEIETDFKSLLPRLPFTSPEVDSPRFGDDAVPIHLGLPRCACRRGKGLCSTNLTCDRQAHGIAHQYARGVNLSIRMARNWHVNVTFI